MTRTPGAFGLLSLLFASCAPVIDTYVVEGADGTEATAKSLPSGASIQDCLELPVGFDTGDTDLSGTEAWCKDADVDGTFDVDSSDPFADGCFCLIAGTLPSEYVQVDETTVLTEDCDDGDAGVTAADLVVYPDTDGDGYGVDGEAFMACGTDGYALVDGDCEYANPDVHPAAAEVCDGLDNNCDGAIDAADDDLEGGTAFYEDGDSDGYGDIADVVLACSQPEGYVDNAEDCDDGDSAINPGATEICDGDDNDCDGDYDDEDDDVLAITGVQSWPDVDSDGYGSDEADATWSCAVPSGSVDNAEDCDDGDSAINPDGAEILDDGIDQDCDGADEVTTSGTDADGDGFDSEASGGTDCDDTDAAVNPDAPEISLNLVDDNCDGAANTSDTIEICVTPEDALSAYEWELWIRDGTVYPDGNDDPDWASPGYADGTGQLCGDFVVIDGNTLVLNGPFDIDGDGTAGEEYVDGDGVWLAMSDGTHYQGDITGDGVPMTLTSISWGAGADLIEVDVDLL